MVSHLVASTNCLQTPPQRYRESPVRSCAAQRGNKRGRCHAPMCAHTTHLWGKAGSHGSADGIHSGQRHGQHAVGFGSLGHTVAPTASNPLDHRAFEQAHWAADREWGCGCAGGRLRSCCRGLGGGQHSRQRPSARTGRLQRGARLAGAGQCGIDRGELLYQRSLAGLVALRVLRKGAPIGVRLGSSANQLLGGLLICGHLLVALDGLSAVQSVEAIGVIVALERGITLCRGGDGAHSMLQGGLDGCDELRRSIDVFDKQRVDSASLQGTDKRASQLLHTDEVGTDVCIACLRVIRPRLLLGEGGGRKPCFAVVICAPHAMLTVSAMRERSLASSRRSV